MQVCEKKLTLKAGERINSVVNILLTNRLRDKPGLKWRGGKVNTLLQQVVKQAFERFIISQRGGREINYITFAKMHAYHRTNLIDPKRYSLLRQRLGYSDFQLLGLSFQLFVDQGVVVKDRKGSKAGDHGQWVSGKRTRLIHLAQRRNFTHDFLLPTKGTHSKTSSNDVSTRYQIGLNTELLL